MEAIIGHRTGNNGGTREEALTGKMQKTQGISAGQDL